MYKRYFELYIVEKSKAVLSKHERTSGGSVWWQKIFQHFQVKFEDDMYILGLQNFHKIKEKQWKYMSVMSKVRRGISAWRAEATGAGATIFGLTNWWCYQFSRSVFTVPQHRWIFMLYKSVYLFIWRMKCFLCKKIYRNRLSTCATIEMAGFLGWPVSGSSTVVQSSTSECNTTTQWNTFVTLITFSKMNIFFPKKFYSKHTHILHSPFKLGEDWRSFGHRPSRSKLGVLQI